MPHATRPALSPVVSRGFRAISGFPGGLGLLLATLLTGCPAPSRPPAGDGGSSGPTLDGGAGGDTPDASTPPDVDAGVVQEASLAPRVPTGARRGPVVLGFEVRNGVPSSFELERAQGSAWVPVTRLATDEEPAGATVVWDSFADVSVDATVSLRFRARVGAAELVAPFELDVRNDPAVDRLVLVGHSMRPLETGGANSTLDKASVLLWDGLSGGIIGTPVRIDVVRGPDKLRAAPHGRATLVLGDADGELELVSTPLDALVSGVRGLERVTLPYGHPADVQWEADGRAFLVAGGLTNAPARPAALWRFRVSDALDVGDGELVTELPGPPSALAVANDGRVLVVCGPGGPGPSKVVLYDATGRELGRVESEEYGPASSLAIAPHGAHALFVADSFLGEQVQAFLLGKTTIETRGALVTTIRAPSDVLFHPASTPAQSSALITNFQANKATPFTLDTGRTAPLAAGTAVSQLPLADQVDGVMRGTQAGAFVVTSVTQTDPGGGQLVWGTLSTTGTATRGGAASLGTGTVTIPSGVSVQR